MIVEKIENTYKQYPKKRILFLFDPSKEHQEEIKLLPNSISVIKVDHRYFDIKIKISKLLIRSDTKILLYHDFERPYKLAQYPLLGLMKSGIELRLDDVAAFLSEYNLPENKRSIVNRWIKFFNKTNKKKLAKILNASDFTEDNLIRGMLCIALDLNTVYDKDVVLMRFLNIGQSSQELTKVVSRMDSLQLSTTFYKWVEEISGIAFTNMTYDDLRSLVNTMKYNIITSEINESQITDSYSQLKITKPHILNRLLNFYETWLDNDKFSSDIEKVFSSIGSDLDEEKLYSTYGIDQSFGYLSKKGSQRIIEQISHDLYNHLKKVSILNQATDRASNNSLIRYQKLIDELTGHVTTDQNEILQFLTYIIQLFKHIYLFDPYNNNDIASMLGDYCEKGYHVDTYFRKVEISKQAKDNSSISTLVELYSLAQKEYNNYLISINSKFLELMNAIQFDYNQIDFPKQYNFYVDQITDVKTAVIISDAFRYELCKELELELLKHDKNQIQITGAIASIPSFTQMGMTNLLPQRNMKLKDEESLVLHMDGIETKSSNRSKILQQLTPSGKGILYKDLIKLNKEEGRAMFKEHKLVYIYHNQVDATSDKQELEDYTFDACNKAIVELERLTRLLYDWNVYHQYITADHGFLFNSLDLRDADREKMPDNKNIIYSDSRSCVVSDPKNHDAGYEFPLRNVTKLDTDHHVIIPRAINRFRRSGKIGLKFVHGGASIQELTVPVLKYYKKNESIREPVNFQRIDKITKIKTATNKFSILQSEAINNRVKPRKLIIGLYNQESDLVSNEVELNLSIVDDRPSERSFHFNLSLNSNSNNENIVKLKAFDLDIDKHRLNPLLDDTLYVSLLSEVDEF